MVSSTRRTAGCGPACPVVWEGRTGNRLPYPDRKVNALSGAILWDQGLEMTPQAMRAGAAWEETSVTA